MRRVVSVVLVVAGVLITAAAMVAGAARAQTPSVLVVGDSIGNGIGLSTKDYGTTNQARTASGLFPSVFGDWSQIITELRPDAYDVVMVSMGSNDLLKYPRKDDYIARIRSFAAQLQAKKVVWFGPPCNFVNWSKNAQAKLLDQWMAEALADVPHVRYISAYQFSLVDGKCLRKANVREPDGIHFTPYGYRELFKMGLS